MYHYDYLTEKTCSNVISLDLDGDKVHNISFMGGCNGNLKTIPMLLEGWTVDEIEKKLTGIECGRRGTSCADQLAKAVRRAYEAMLNGEVQELDED
ncbi:MAG: TIGR03905 family TSCPD domain-containing protein [Lachnospiraceae bacterium]|nr:TIGR03905 family TSCPD domain-containing protein [Lachnospiraceae bacterium]